MAFIRRPRVGGKAVAVFGLVLRIASGTVSSQVEKAKYLSPVASFSANLPIVLEVA